MRHFHYDHHAVDALIGKSVRVIKTRRMYLYQIRPVSDRSQPRIGRINSEGNVEYPLLKNLQGKVTTAMRDYPTGDVTLRVTFDDGGYWLCGPEDLASVLNTPEQVRDILYDDVLLGGAWVYNDLLLITKSDPYRASIFSWELYHRNAFIGGAVFAQYPRIVVENFYAHVNDGKDSYGRVFYGFAERFPGGLT